jgi:hypothetical protein
MYNITLIDTSPYILIMPHFDTDTLITKITMTNLLISNNLTIKTIILTKLWIL